MHPDRLSLLMARGNVKENTTGYLLDVLPLCDRIRIGGTRRARYSRVRMGIYGW